MFVIGGIGGVGGLAYITLPYNEELRETSDVYFSKSGNSNTVKLAEGVQPAQEGAVAVHFLELGNKYTGDCTYIKVGENTDILIDCGSKSNSVATVSNYLNQYVTDGVLEYVIITHGHQDHYAGFATTAKVDSIFDLYECETIITFATTNQKLPLDYINNAKTTADSYTSKLGIVTYGETTSSKSTLYANFNRELSAELETKLTKGEKAGQYPEHLTAVEVLEQYNDGKIVLDESNDINLQILNNNYYTNKGHENNYSVCTLLNQGDKYFIFTGDLESDGEAYLVQESNNPVLHQPGFSVEVYKAGHHGSKTSSSLVLLNVINPKIVCVCCCAGSSEYTKAAENQFPTEIFIENISRFTTQVYVTTLCIDYDNDEFTSFNGNIVVMAKKDDMEVSVYCSNNKTPLKDTEWFINKRYEMCKDAFNYNEISRQWLKEQ